MKIKIVWFAVVVTILVHFVIQFKYFKFHDDTDIGGKIIFLIETGSNIMTIALFGSALAGLISLIPFQRNSFKEKFKVAIPFCLLVVMIILIVSTGYIAYLKESQGIQVGPYQN